jgi:hypothetical protein
LVVIAAFLGGIAREAQRRGYQFNLSKILNREFRGQILETEGQLLFEWRHLKTKLRARAPLLAAELRNIPVPQAHPLFRIVPGEVKSWEKK